MVEKISSRKGNTKKQAQKYQNQTEFRHNKGSKLTKEIAALPIQGVCSKCRKILEWRKKFRKYKPLTTLKKCVRCDQRNIKEAYHTVCVGCAHKDGICAKCLETEDTNNNQVSVDENSEKSLLSKLKERHRRAFLRKKEQIRDPSDLLLLIEEYSMRVIEVDEEDAWQDSDSDSFSE